MATKAATVALRCTSCDRVMKNATGLGHHLKAHPECRRELPPETFPGHSQTVLSSIKSQPVILVPGILFLLIGLIYVLRSPGLTSWALILGAPIITAVVWWIVLRAALSSVVVLHEFKGQPFWDWQYWPNAIAERLPDEARWIHKGKVIYVIDRREGPTDNREAASAVFFTPLVDKKSLIRPELVARFITQRDHQTVNREHGNALRAEVIKTSLMVAILGGFALGNYVVAQKILSG